MPEAGSDSTRGAAHAADCASPWQPPGVPLPADGARSASPSAPAPLGAAPCAQPRRELLPRAGSQRRWNQHSRGVRAQPAFPNPADSHWPVRIHPGSTGDALPAQSSAPGQLWDTQHKFQRKAEALPAKGQGQDRELLLRALSPGSHSQPSWGGAKSCRPSCSASCDPAALQKPQMFLCLALLWTTSSLTQLPQRVFQALCFHQPQEQRSPICHSQETI